MVSVHISGLLQERNQHRQRDTFPATECIVQSQCIRCRQSHRNVQVTTSNLYMFLEIVIDPVKETADLKFNVPLQYFMYNNSVINRSITVLSYDGIYQ